MFLVLHIISMSLFIPQLDLEGLQCFESKEEYLILHS
jgi:hypothetical protein